MQSGQKGVAGPNQKAKYVAAIPVKTGRLVINPSVPQTQIGDVIISKTTANINRFLVSLICIQTHLKKLIILILNFRIFNLLV